MNSYCEKCGKPKTGNFVVNSAAAEMPWCQCAMAHVTLDLTGVEFQCFNTAGAPTFSTSPKWMLPPVTSGTNTL